MEELRRQHDGAELRAYLFRPDKPAPGSHGVIVYMDIHGIRRGLFEVCERIASFGHSVLLPDVYFRLGPYEPCTPAEAAANETLRAQRRAMREKTPVDLTASDTAVFVDLLTSHDISGKIATVGYCMGGARAMRAAHAAPDRVVLAASFHGGNLATDDPSSPHLHLDGVRARFYVGAADRDGSYPPEQAALFIETLMKAGIETVHENYNGCSHGWVFHDNPKIHNAAGAERHFARLATQFSECLI